MSKSVITFIEKIDYNYDIENDYDLEHYDDEVETDDYEVTKIIEKVAYFLQKCVIEDCCDLGFTIIQNLSTLYIMVNNDDEITKEYWTLYLNNDYEQCMLDLTHCIFKAIRMPMQ